MNGWNERRVTVEEHWRVGMVGGFGVVAGGCEGELSTGFYLVCLGGLFMFSLADACWSYSLGCW